MKKNILALAVLSAVYSYANDFVVLVDKEQNSYEVGDISSGHIIEYTPWVTVSTSNCVVVNDWKPEEVYNNVSYDKTSTCDENQERDKETYVYQGGNKKLIKTEKESQTVEDVVRIESLVGTFKAKTCLEVMNSHGSIGDGNYTLTVSGQDFSNYCDMTNGGWTLALHLNGYGQLQTGNLNRDSFWDQGSTLASYTTNTFTQLHLSDNGFLGWNRVNEMIDTSDLEVNIRGVNSLNQNIDEKYTLQNFNPNMSDNVADTGTMVGGGEYSISKRGDANSLSLWGTCGTTRMTDAHIGIGICPLGFTDYITPHGREVQIWHYGTHYGAYNYGINVSFGHSSTGSNHTYHNGKSTNIYMYIK